VTTIDELFDVAIKAERTAARLYRALAGLFKEQPSVAAFWMSYAGAEEQHAAWLVKTREGLSDARRRAPADPEIVENLDRVQRVSVDDLVADIETLDDAYQLASDLENSETNAIFGFIVDNFAEDADTQAFLQAQLRDHVRGLMISFPKEFGTRPLRRAVLVES
jgi:rubrerythrin